MVYRFALNYNQTTGFQDFFVQPKCEGLEWPSNSEEFAGSGGLIRNGGMQAKLQYGFLIKRDYNQILQDLDLISNEYRFITIYLPRNEDRVFTRYNAIIRKPNHPRDGVFKKNRWENVVFELYNIRRI